MSFSITENFVNQFGANFRILGQQRASRLQGFCQIEPNIVGTSKTVERIGKSEVYDIDTRHADTKYVDTPHSRRWLDLADKGWSDLVDEMDKIKMLADPTSPYTAIGVAAHNRYKDTAILTAARGSARANGASIALPAGQKIAVNAQGLTLDKLNAARELLDAAEIDMDESDGQGHPTRVIAVTARQLTNLLNTTEIKSVDYNNVKALVQGQIDTFLGFKFVRTQLVPKVGNDRMVCAWVKGSVAFGWGMDTKQRISELPTKNYSVQVYASGSYGAVRVEDEGVVEIACLES